MTHYPDITTDPAPATTPIPLPTDSAEYPQTDRGGDTSTADVAKQQAADVKDSATDAAAQVGQTAKEQASVVTSEVKDQATSLLHQTRAEVTAQAGTQQQRAAGSLRSLSDELHSMADRSEDNGPATSLAKQAADQVGTVAGWLEGREPGEVLADVKTFARQKPGTFLLLAAGAGLVAGRLTRGLTADEPAAAGNGNTARTPAAADFTPAVPPVRSEPGALAAPGQAAYTGDLTVDPGHAAVNPATGGPLR